MADIELLPTEKGGRRGPTSRDKFGCPLGIAGEFFDMRIDLSNWEFVAGPDGSRAEAFL